MRILIAGSHGLVGTALIKSLLNGGHDIFKLVRYTPHDQHEIEWSPERFSIAISRLEGFDAVVNLAGESIAEGSWTDEKKKRIRDSRINGTRLLSDVLPTLDRPPKAFVCASAIGYYGNRGDETLTEASGPGDDFLSDVCVDWEEATSGSAEKGIRVVNTRFGVILDKQGGALAKMLPPFRMGVGGRVGSGKQWMSWITLADVIRGLEFALTSDGLSGPVNYVSPNPVTNAEFTRALGKVLSRPTIFPIPAFGVRLLFGEMADALLLASQKVQPEKLTQAGFNFKHDQLENALRDVLSD
jgi:uncharacterized protein (TIGR01777 family)